MFRQRIRIGITWRPALVVMLLLPSLARSQQDTPAPLNWESHTASAIDLSRFLIPPAGQSGFVRADGERLVDGNGKRVRLWGVNLGGPACFPTHEQAEALADSFARMGFNCVRFHGLDSNWGRSSIDRSGGDTLSLNESDLERFDYLDGHGYWQHPSIGAVTRTGNDPMVNDPADSTIVQFARTPMVGKPFVVSETNHPYPHVYAVEGIPLMTTYAMLQDWDGVLFHEWGDGTYHPSASIPRNGWFQLSRDPLKVAELVLSGLLWHRNDIRPAS